MVRTLTNLFIVQIQPSPTPTASMVRKINNPLDLYRVLYTDLLIIAVTGKLRVVNNKAIPVIIMAAKARMNAIPKAGSEYDLFCGSTYGLSYV